MGRFYVTTPIYYVNDVPHLGTAYTTIVADALRRFHLAIGDETYMLTGTDEHGQKIERVAKEENLDPKAFTDKISARFKEAWPKLDIHADRFIRTTDPDHEAWVAELWKKIEANGDLYVDSYEDWYCVGCEGFKTEKELEQPGNLCPLHKKPVEKIKEETYFFRLSKWEKPLLDFYARHPEFIQPESRRNEVLSFVQGGLKDLSVSRTSFSWGIPVPSNPKHVMYVWFDALSNYRSALGEGLAKFWAPNAEVVHLVGKDILRFHAIFWPAFLLSAGFKEEELPKTIFAHGFLTVDGQKMSKSLRNAVDPLRLAAELGPDVLRYHLLRAITFGLDGDFDHHALLERSYNGELGKNLGNLLSRVLGLCVKAGLATHPDDDPSKDTPLEQELDAKFVEHVTEARKHWLGLAPHLALEETMKLSSAANTYVDRAAPWAATKAGDTARVAKILSRLLRVLDALSVMIWPAMPGKSDAMRAQLGLEPLRVATGQDQWPSKLPPPRTTATLPPAKPLFPTYDDKAQKELLDRLMPKVEPAEQGGKMSDQSPSPAAAPPPTPADAAPAAITYDDFAKVDLRVGLVKTAEKVPKKDKLLRLTVDLGEAEPRQIVAGLALTFAPETLVGRKVIVVANLAPREFGSADFGSGKVKLVSHGMLLATGPSEALHLATVDGDVAPGSRLK